MDSRLSKIKESDAKLFFLILYGDTTFPWIRRQETRYVVDVRGLCERFKNINGRSRSETEKEMTKAFKRLQNIGWLYNYRHDKFFHRFAVRIPEWLTISELGKLTEKYVPKDPKYGEDNSDAPCRPSDTLFTNLAINGHHDDNPFAAEWAERDRKIAEARAKLEIEEESSAVTPEDIFEG